MYSTTRRGIVFPWSTFPWSKRVAYGFLTISKFLDLTLNAVRLLKKIIHLRVLILNSKLRSFPQHSLTFWAGFQQHFGILQAASERCVVCVWVVLNLSLFGKGARANTSDRDDEACSSILWCLCYSYVMMMTSGTWLEQKCLTTCKHERVKERENNRFGHWNIHAVDCILVV